MSMENKQGAKEGAKKVQHRCTLTILDNIKKDGSIPWGVASKRSILYALRQLLDDGMIAKIGYGTWEATPKGLEALKQGATSPHPPAGGVHGGGAKVLAPTSILQNIHQVRGHAFLWRLKVVDHDWGASLSKLGLKAETWQTGLKGNVKASRINFNGVSLDFFQKAVLVRFPQDFDFLGANALACEREARDHCMRTIKTLEDLGLDLKLNGHYNLTLSKAEYAEMRNELAEEFRKRGKGMLLRAPDGKPWLMIDHSHGVPELETVHPSKAQVDMDEVIKPFFEDLRKDPCTLSDLKTEVKEIAQGVQVLVEVVKLQYPKRGGDPEPPISKEGLTYVG